MYERVEGPCGKRGEENLDCGYIGNLGSNLPSRRSHLERDYRVETLSSV